MHLKNCKCLHSAEVALKVKVNLKVWMKVKVYLKEGNEEGSSLMQVGIRKISTALLHSAEVVS